MVSKVTVAGTDPTVADTDGVPGGLALPDPGTEPLELDPAATARR